MSEQPLAEKAKCGCVIGGIHEYACASVGHVDPPRPAAEKAQQAREAMTEVMADLLAQHGDYHVNDDGWTVCLCGHVAEGDDDDGSHARHVAAVLVADGWRHHPWLSDALSSSPGQHPAHPGGDQ